MIRNDKKAGQDLETFYFQKTNLGHNDREEKLWVVFLYVQKLSRAKPAVKLSEGKVYQDD